MRPIKFRAWDKRTQQMHSIFQITYYNDGMRASYLMHQEYGGGETKVEGEGLIVMQFTGLHDKNGKEIYEGDILSYTRKNMSCAGTSFNGKDLINRVLIFSDGVTLRYNLHDEKRCFSSGILTKTSFQDERATENTIEVIGNIYENPELLEET